MKKRTAITKTRSAKGKSKGCLKKKGQEKSSFPPCVLGKGQKVVRSLELSASLENLVLVRETAEKTGLLHGLSARQTTRMKLCVDEAFTNIVRHAYKEKDSCNHVFVDFIKGPREFTVCLRDRGTPFRLDFKRLTWPNLEKYIELEKKGGLGLFVMKKFSDHLRIQNKNGVNILVLKYRLTK
jgi:serine/threonine-protein kinase RsbW